MRTINELINSGKTLNKREREAVERHLEAHSQRISIRALNDMKCRAAIQKDKNMGLMDKGIWGYKLLKSSLEGASLFPNDLWHGMRMTRPWNSEIVIIKRELQSFHINKPQNRMWMIKRVVSKKVSVFFLPVRSLMTASCWSTNSQADVITSSLRDFSVMFIRLKKLVMSMECQTLRCRLP